MGKQLKKKEENLTSTLMASGTITPEEAAITLVEAMSLIAFKPEAQWYTVKDGFVAGILLGHAEKEKEGWKDLLIRNWDFKFTTVVLPPSLVKQIDFTQPFVILGAVVDGLVAFMNALPLHCVIEINPFLTVLDEGELMGEIKKALPHFEDEAEKEMREHFKDWGKKKNKRLN